MTSADWIKVLVAIITFLATSLLAWLGTQIVKYRKLAKGAENETIKKTIVDTLSTGLEPIKTDIGDLKNDVGNFKMDMSGLQSDIGKMKTEIRNLQNSEINFSTRLKPMQDEIEHLKDDIQELLNSLEQQGLDLEDMRKSEEILQKETRSAWRYRIRQLCHVYMERGCMTANEYDQLQKMFGIYEAIGGNGQTKDLYDRTKVLPIKPKEEVEYIDSKK